jgi:hypothetical protein
MQPRSENCVATASPAGIQTRQSESARVSVDSPAIRLENRAIACRIIARRTQRRDKNCTRSSGESAPACDRQEPIKRVIERA